MKQEKEMSGSFMFRRAPRGVCLGLLALTALACQGPTGRVKDDTEGTLVGSRTAGAETYDRQVAEVVTKMLASHSAQHGVTRATMCVLGIENQGAEDLGDWSEQLYDTINVSINQSRAYRTLSRRVLDRALQESNLRQDDLLLPKYQRKFIEVLEAEGNPAEILVFPKISTGTTQSEGGVSQRDYLLTLELIDVARGWDDVHTAKVSKEYTR